MRFTAHPATLFFVLLLALVAPPAVAQYEQQGSPFTPSSGNLGIDNTGIASSMMSDGNTIIAGSPTDNSNVGGAWIFTRVAGAWSQVGAKLVGTGYVGATPQQAASVAISGDGSTAVIGAANDNSGVGAVWVFARVAGVWTQQGAKIVPTTGEVGAGQFGFSVALSSDGNTLAVGALGDNTYVGAVWVFTRSGGVWSQQGAKLVGSGGAGQGDQGYSVSISADGNTLLEGGAVDNNQVGAAWVFTRSGTTWTQQGSKLVGTGATGFAQQGISVSLSADATTAAIGGNFDNNQTGAVWIFTRSGSVWTQQGGKLVGTGFISTPWQGVNTALTANGNLLVTSGYRDNSYTGALWVFTRTAGTWSQLGTKITATGVGTTPAFGNSIAVSGDGSTLEAGIPYNTLLGGNLAFVRPAPGIVSVKDVPNDQGGQVSIQWTASVIDYTPGDPITAYGVWRQVPTSTAARLFARGSRLLRDRASAAAPGDLRMRADQAGAINYWEYLGSEPAHGFAGYSYTAPTTSDSLPGSNPYTYFMVEAQQTAAGLYWPSDPDSGYSVDNIAPPTPAAFAGTYTSGSTQLLWQADAAPDLQGYRVYRGVTASFPISPSDLVVALGANVTSYLDVAGAAYYYKLTAVDLHGNESAPATLLPSGVTGVAEGAGSSALSLAHPNPNPMSRSTSIRFSLPRNEEATLAVYDATGRRVRMLQQGPANMGIHGVVWDGRDASGREVSVGIYFVQLNADGNTLTQRIALVR
jgi:flagellar hook capping protein FlgD